MARSAHSPEHCPVCGVTVPPRAAACPGCGADERTGWDEEAARYDGLDLPEETGDADERRRDRVVNSRVVPNGVPVFWWAVGLVLLLGMLLAVVGPMFF